jgi:hypothetical protein
MSNLKKEQRIEMWKTTIDELREEGCNKLADLYVDELNKELVTIEVNKGD